MHVAQGLPRGGPLGLEYLFMLISATLAALGGGAAKAWSRSRRLLLCTPRRTWTPMLRPGRKGTVLLLLGALVLPLQAGAQTAAEEEPLAEPVRREILAVYDSREEPRPDQTRIHRFAEMPLNHLGFVLTYWDVNAGLPGPDRTETIRGVITWFRRAPPPRFFFWGEGEGGDGGSIVVVG